MMTGFVTADRAAVMQVVFKGTNGIEAGLQVTINTGFSEQVSLSQSWIDAMALLFSRFDDVTMADGRVVQTGIYKGIIVWDGQDKTVEVHCLESDPLIGMSLLLDFLLTLPVRVGSTLTLTPMP